MKRIIILLLIACSFLRSSAQEFDEAPQRLLILGAYRGADFFSFHGVNEKPTPFTGLYAHLKYKKISLIGDFTYLDRIIDEQQIINPFYSNTYRVSIGNSVCMTLGYADNKWVTTANTPYGDNNTRITDESGRSYFLKQPLIQYSAPSYIFGYHFMSARVVDAGNTEVILDDYDRKHQKKYRPTYFISGIIDLMYAPKITMDNDILYSPYGYYVPRTLQLSSPMKQRHFGFNFRMMVTTPYAVGLYMAIGMLPSAFSTDVDNKMNVNARAGVVLNFSRVKK